MALCPAQWAASYFQHGRHKYRPYNARDSELAGWVAYLVTYIRLQSAYSNIAFTVGPFGTLEDAQAFAARYSVMPVALDLTRSELELAGAVPVVAFYGSLVEP
jgi:hypothetical protein